MLQQTEGLTRLRRDCREHLLRSATGAEIGVIYDVAQTRDGDPEFFVVRLPRRWYKLAPNHRLVPVHRSFWAGDDVVTPFERPQVSTAPTLSAGQTVEARVRLAIEEHYHLWFVALMERIPGCDALAGPATSRGFSEVVTPRVDVGTNGPAPWSQPAVPMVAS